MNMFEWYPSDEIRKWLTMTIIQKKIKQISSKEPFTVLLIYFICNLNEAIF